MVYPEVISGVDVGIAGSVVLALLGAALLLLVAAWAHGRTRAVSRVARPVPIEQFGVRFERVRAHLPEPTLSFGASRAPPLGLSRQQPPAMRVPFDERC